MSSFSELRTGLDRVGMLVDSPEALHACAGWLTRLGVPHQGIKDLPGFGMAALLFRDPDRIPIELLAYT
jgi:glyoxylase I family protein